MNEFIESVLIAAVPSFVMATLSYVFSTRKSKKEFEKQIQLLEKQWKRDDSKELLASIGTALSAVAAWEQQTYNSIKKTSAAEAVASAMPSAKGKSLDLLKTLSSELVKENASPEATKRLRLLIAETQL